MVQEAFSLRWKADDGSETGLNVSIEFNANANFDCFTSSSCICDGTLFFIRETMDRCVQKCASLKHIIRMLGNQRTGIVSGILSKTLWF